MRELSLRRWALVLCVCVLSCASPPPESWRPSPEPALERSPSPSNSVGTRINNLQPNELNTLASMPKSKWLSASWNDLSGFENDPTHEIWHALITLCEKPHPALQPLCPQLRALSLEEETEQRLWLMTHFQPMQVISKEPTLTNKSATTGLLTSYFEPELKAQLHPDGTYKYPLYAPPVSLLQAKAMGKAWFTRQDIESNAQLQLELEPLALAWMADPIDVMMVHVQGSAKLRVSESNGQTRLYRLKFAASNDQPYVSMARFMLEQGLIKDASWASMRNALNAHPEMAQASLWSNPRYVFFKLEAMLPGPLEPKGPIGAWGVPLLSKRSIAVDPNSIPLGLPVWLSSLGNAPLQRLVLTQDTGGAIQGAVRADFFAGSGEEAGLWASQMRQPLQFWVLWPKTQAPPHLE